MDTTPATHTLPANTDGTSATHLDGQPTHLTRNAAASHSSGARRALPLTGYMAHAQTAKQKAAEADTFADFLTRHQDHMSTATVDLANRTAFLLVAGRVGAAHLTATLRDVPGWAREELIYRATTSGRKMPHLMFCSAVAGFLWQYTQHAPGADLELETATAPLGMYAAPLWRHTHSGKAFADHIGLRGTGADHGNPEAEVSNHLDFWNSNLGPDFIGLRHLPLLNQDDARWYWPDGTSEALGHRPSLDERTHRTGTRESDRRPAPTGNVLPRQWGGFLEMMTPEPRPAPPLLDPKVSKAGHAATSAID